MKWALKGAALVGLFLSVCFGFPREQVTLRPAQALTKPNIILVLTDDQDLRSLAHMPG